MHGGASGGFLAPLGESEAEAWWREAIGEHRAGRRCILLARQDERVVGTVHLAFSPKPNARHRAEVQKLLVHSRARRQGIGRYLMTVAERTARQRGISLLLLDTETGSEAASFYERLGWNRVGDVPDHSSKPYGGLAPTTFYYKQLGKAPDDPR